MAMPEELVIQCVKTGSLRFKFTLAGNNVRIAMVEDDGRLIGDPLYSPWLIKFILDNPRAEGMIMCKYEFSPSPGNMQVNTVPIFIKHSDIVRINSWLNEYYS